MNPIVKKNAVNYGIVLALVTMLISTIMYVVDLKLFVNMGIGFGQILIFLVVYGVMLHKTKKEMGGQMTFKDAFTTYFIAAGLRVTLATVFMIFLFNVVDVEAKEIVKEHTVKFQVEIMQKMGSTKQQMEEAIRELKESDQFGIATQIKGMAFALLGVSIAGLIFAAIFKSKEQTF